MRRRGRRPCAASQATGVNSGTGTSKELGGAPRTQPDLRRRSRATQRLFRGGRGRTRRPHGLPRRARSLAARDPRGAVSTRHLVHVPFPRSCGRARLAAASEPAPSSTRRDLRSPTQRCTFSAWVRVPLPRRCAAPAHQEPVGTRKSRAGDRGLQLLAVTAAPFRISPSLNAGQVAADQEPSLRDPPVNAPRRR